MTRFLLRNLSKLNERGFEAEKAHQVSFLFHRKLVDVEKGLKIACFFKLVFVMVIPFFKSSFKLKIAHAFTHFIIICVFIIELPYNVRGCKTS
jgi:hypothetical protein